MLDEINVNIDEAGDMLIGAATLTCIGMIFFAGSAIAFSMVTALLATASVLYLLLKGKDGSRIGAKIWNFTMDHRIKSDILISGAFVIMFGTGTATALLSAGAAGVMTSYFLSVFAKRIGKVEIPVKHKKCDRINQEALNADDNDSETKTAA